MTSSLVYPDATPLEYVKDLLGQLPKDHIALLKCLLKLLHRVASEETSKMNAHNLGTQLSGPTPSFFCDREGMRFVITTTKILYRHSLHLLSSGVHRT